MTLPQEISKRIEAEAKKAAMVIEWEGHNPGPSNSARMQQTSRVDPIQKEFYIRGATEWAGKAQDDLLTLLDEARLQIEYLHKKFGATGSGNNVLSRIETALAKYKEVSNG